MAKNRRKSAAIALAVIGVAGLSLASASTLSLTGGTVQAGVTNLTDCQLPATGAIKVTFGTPAFSTNLYNAGAVTLSNVDPGCVGKKVRITLLTGTAPAYVAIGTEMTGTLTAATTFTPATSPVVPAGSVTGAAVVISD